MSRLVSKIWPRRVLFYTPGSDLRKLNKISTLTGAAAPDFIAVDIGKGSKFKIINFDKKPT